MRRSHATFLALALGACAGRTIDVRSNPPPVANAPALTVTNNLAQAVNVYVVSGGYDIFIRQVPPRTTERLSVQGVSIGSNVSLKAVSVDGRTRRLRENVLLGPSSSWEVP